MVISSMNFKGGAGKTMVCTNLAVAFAQAGKKVCIVDTDDSFAATKWAGRREEQGLKPSIPIAQMTEPKTIVALVRQLDQDNDVIIIDGPPRLNALVSKIILLSDMVIIPVPPKSGNDREVTEDFLQRFDSIQEQRTDNTRTAAYLLPNMVKDNYNLHTTFIASLPILCEDYGVKIFDTRLNDLVGFGEANQFGLGVTEYTSEKAKKQFLTLYSEIITKLQN
jgi:chromosome partitioning protein